MKILLMALLTRKFIVCSIQLIILTDIYKGKIMYVNMHEIKLIIIAIIIYRSTFKDDNSSGENFASSAIFHNPCTLGSINSL